jgi:hypothetical protein
MAHPYMPVGKVDMEKQKKNEIQQAIKISEKYKGDKEIEKAIQLLNEVVGG